MCVKEDDSDRVKVRYIGYHYGSEHVEWRAKEDIILDDPDSVMI